MNKDTPLRSMTGFGQAKSAVGTYSYEVEIRSVNHRYLEVSIKLPKGLNALEHDVRSYVTARLRRGKVDLNIGRRSLDSVSEDANFDSNSFTQYMGTYKKIIEEQGCSFEDLKKDVIFEILRRPDIFRTPEYAEDIEREKAAILKVLDAALDQLLNMRRAEGTKLANDLTERLRVLRSLHRQIETAAQGLQEKFRERIQSRVKKLEPEIIVDENRLVAEAVLYCDRADVTEELVRLSSHFSQFESALQEEGQGRKLDFISQEFLREFNTISSKAQDASIQALVVEAKTEIEKLKEQLQNIE